MFHVINNGDKINYNNPRLVWVNNRVDVNGKIDVGKLDDNAAKELFDS